MTSRRRSPPIPPAGFTPAERRPEPDDGWIAPTPGRLPRSASTSSPAPHGRASRDSTAAHCVFASAPAAVDGAANRELLAVVANALGVRRHRSNDRERRARPVEKRLRVTGIAADAARERARLN